MSILEFSRLLASPQQDIIAWLQPKCAQAAKLPWCCHLEVTGVMPTGM